MTAPQLADPGPPPARLGRYHPTRVIGDGGLSVLYEAVDPDTGDRVAIKLLRRERSSPADHRRLCREAALLHRLRGGYLVDLYDVGTAADGRPFLVVQLATRGSLSDRLVAQVRSDPWSTHRIVRAVEGAVGALHDAGVVHGDVHPGNLLISGPGTPLDAGVHPSPRLVEDDEELLLCDLDTAVDLDDTERLVRSCGTPRFQAPEQQDSDLPMNPATDVYGATAVLWAVVTGTSPPHPPEVPEYLAGVPPDWRTVLETGLHPEPQRRFASMASWAGAVVDALNLDLLRAGHAPLT